MPDHLHIVVSIPPRIAVSDFVRRLKSAPSLLVNRAEGGSRLDAFAWQAEYGVLTFGERSLPDVVAYVQNQPAHHADSHLREPYELTERLLPAASRS
jgi:putative transposase